MKTFDCGYCKDHGIYVGIAERNGSAVVCYYCHGKTRNHKENVKRVFQANIYFAITTDNGLSLTDYGGMPYEDWLGGKEFPVKSEMRILTCPM